MIDNVKGSNLKTVYLIFFALAAFICICGAGEPILSVAPPTANEIPMAEPIIRLAGIRHIVSMAYDGKGCLFTCAGEGRIDAVDLATGKVEHVGTNGTFRLNGRWMHPRMPMTASNGRVWILNPAVKRRGISEYRRGVGLVKSYGSSEGLELRMTPQDIKLMGDDLLISSGYRIDLKAETVHRVPEQEGSQFLAPIDTERLFFSGLRPAGLHLYDRTKPEIETIEQKRLFTHAMAANPWYLVYGGPRFGGVVSATTRAAPKAIRHLLTIYDLRDMSRQDISIREWEAESAGMLNQDSLSLLRNLACVGGNRYVILVDLESRKVLRSFSVPGLVTATCATEDAFLVAAGNAVYAIDVKRDLKAMQQEEGTALQRMRTKEELEVQQLRQAITIALHSKDPVTAATLLPRLNELANYLEQNNQLDTAKLARAALGQQVTKAAVAGLVSPALHAPTWSVIKPDSERGKLVRDSRDLPLIEAILKLSEANSELVYTRDGTTAAAVMLAELCRRVAMTDESDWINHEFRTERRMKRPIYDELHTCFRQSCSPKRYLGRPEARDCDPMLALAVEYLKRAHNEPARFLAQFFDANDSYTENDPDIWRDYEGSCPFLLWKQGQTRIDDCEKNLEATRKQDDSGELQAALEQTLAAIEYSIALHQSDRRWKSGHDSVVELNGLRERLTTFQLELATHAENAGNMKEAERLALMALSHVSLHSKLCPTLKILTTCGTSQEKVHELLLSRFQSSNMLSPFEALGEEIQALEGPRMAQIFYACGLETSLFALETGKCPWSDKQKLTASLRKSYEKMAHICAVAISASKDGTN